MDHSYEVIIVGAGLVGCTLAIALGQAGRRVALLEKSAVQKSQTSNDSRPLSLTHTTVQALRALTIWPELMTTAAPITQVHVSQQGALGALHFNAADYHLSALGYVVPAARLQQVLLEQAQRYATLIYADSFQLKNQVDDNTIILQQADQTLTLQAKLVVGCDGTHSSVAQQLNLNATETDTGIVAQTAYLTVEDSINSIAYERFTEYGVLAVLPMWQANAARLVWSLPAATLITLQQKTNAEQLALIQTIFAGRCNITNIELAESYPIKLKHLNQITAPGVIIIGNAAHTLSPLAAQGFNLGLRDAAVLAQAIVEQKIQNFSQERANDLKNIQRINQLLMCDLQTNYACIKAPRGLSLLALDLLPPLKHRLVRQLLGLTGQTPKLLRGLMLSA